MTIREPFPAEAIPDLYQWLASVPAIARAPEFPADWPTFEAQMKERLGRVRSWGVYAGDGSLSGAVILEPFGAMAVQGYVVSARWAWGKGWLDEAVRQIFAIMFTGEYPVDYIIALVKERNHPARAFCERVEMRLKNVFPDLRAYEITREQWAAIESGAHKA